jgi:damage-control phosphatase, subfamily I
MKATLDCIPCFVRQTLEAIRLSSIDPAGHEKIIREILGLIMETDLNMPPPALGQKIHRRLREITGVEDFYMNVKDHQNQMALGLIPAMRTVITSSSDPLMTTVRLAIAGNIISMSVSADVTEYDVHRSITQSLTEPSYLEEKSFKQSIAEAGDILYLADNAGEIVFDRLLIEQLPKGRVTMAVRGGPVSNDAMIKDAQAAGIQEIADIIDTGSDAAGIILEDCSQEFNMRFKKADLIISKGQGNFETLNSETRNIFFLFKIKCSVIAAHFGLPVGTHILRRQSVKS